jgi:hypothetical protein
MASGIGRSISIALRADTKDFGKKTKQVEKDLKTLKNSVAKIGKSVAIGFGVMGAALAKFAFDATMAASTLAESQSKVGVIFGKSAKDIEKFSDSAAKSFGISKQSALDASSNFAIFGKAAGLSGPKLTGFSKKLVATAADMASFSDSTPQEAIEALGAALRGEMEPIRKYGVLLDAETLKNRGTIMGFGKEIGTSLTGGQRIMFATAEIMAQLGKEGSNTLGDFERTSESVANKQRRMTAEFENTKVKLGTALLPIMSKFATFMLEKVVPNVQMFVDGLTGVKDGSNDATKAAYDFGVKVKGFVKWLGDNIGLVKNFGIAIAALFVVGSIAKPLAAIARLVTAYNGLAASAGKAAAAESVALSGGGKTGLLTGIGKKAGIAGAIIGGGIGISNVIGNKGKVSEGGALGVTSGPTAIITRPNTPSGALSGVSGGTTVVNNFNITGAVDPEASKRAIQKVLQMSNRRMGPVDLVGSGI